MMVKKWRRPIIDVNIAYTCLPVAGKRNLIRLVRHLRQSLAIGARVCKSLSQEC
jgi:hypothetical protein